jgi:hypothetical protein
VWDAAWKWELLSVPGNDDRRVALSPDGRHVAYSPDGVSVAVRAIPTAWW